MPIIVKTKGKNVFWRAGRKFGPEPVEIPDGELSPELRAILKNEPMLAVTEPEPALEMDFETPAKPSKPKKK